MNRTLARAGAPAWLLVIAACSGTPPPDQSGAGGNSGGSSPGGGGAQASAGGATGGIPGVTGGGTAEGGAPTPGFDPERPAQGGEETRAWLETGAYREWACEPEPHASRSPSPHGFNRICSNAVLAAAADGSGEWPEGAAGVKEFFESEDATEPSGYSVYLKLAPDSDGGDNWYWYERFPSGLVTARAGATICTRCHGAAGSNAANTPTPGARDYVFTPVR